MKDTSKYCSSRGTCSFPKQVSSSNSCGVPHTTCTQGACCGLRSSIQHLATTTSGKEQQQRAADDGGLTHQSVGGDWHRRCRHPVVQGMDVPPAFQRRAYATCRLSVGLSLPQSAPVCPRRQAGSNARPCCLMAGGNGDG